MLSQTLLRVAVDCAIFLLAVGCTYAAQQADRPITAVLIFLTGVILIAFRSGLSSAIVAAIAASFVYNFFLSEPTFQFGITSADEAVPLIAFNIAALFAGALVGRLKDSALKAYNAQSETAFLLTVSDRLQSAVKLEDVEDAIRGIIPRQGVKTVEIFLARGKAFVRPSTGEVEFDQLKPFMEAVEPEDKLGKPVFMELTGARGPLGLVKFRLADLPADRSLMPNLKSIAALLALAVERCLLLEEAAEAKAAARNEKLKDALLSSVSHDLRTPVTVIQAAAGALRSGQVSLGDDDRLRFLGSILEQCAKLDRYTSELLDVGQIQSGIAEDQFEIVDLTEIARLAMKQAKASHTSLKFEHNFSSEPAFVRANGTMLEQAIYNVIDNAQKFGGQNGPVRVNLVRDEDRVTISITDSGPGIFEHERPHVFTRFFKGGKDSSKSGMGLGLFIAKGFVEAFSGTISMESPLKGGNGTRVTIDLPLVQSPDAAAAA
ncbi:ATP-binding protein [Altererythrobacter sp. GH1-8]|uniref:ATP-binding protein n=1 Tax=Altererythrobacter sp. GH1-8 TaxID=3349333 RepID=UPI00374D718E